MQAMQEMQFSSVAVKSGMSEVVNAFNFDYKTMTVAQCLAKIIKDLNYEDYLKDEAEDGQADDRLENVQELIRDAARFAEEKKGDVTDYLEQIALATASDKSADGDAVSLMSLHASKGLEFPVVFMLGVEQNILPHKKAVDERKDGIQEERRLCYVGMTRAKNILSVSYCTRRQDGFAAVKGKVSYKNSLPSQFLSESGLLKKQEPQASDFTTNRRQGYNQSKWDYCS
jgi:DNA helicase-2/ATP-dependent DNA helicase PcrA